MKNPDEVLTIKLTREQVAQLVAILDYFGLTEQDQRAICLSHNIRDEINFYRRNVDRCVCCGDIIPEGRQVCPKCEAKAAVNGEYGFKKYGINHAYPANIINNYTDTDIVSVNKEKTDD